MNERINELFEQAAKEFSAEHKYATFIVPNPLKEKFAELIVKECYEECKGQMLPDEMAESEGYTYNDGVMDCAIGLLRHFRDKDNNA